MFTVWLSKAVYRSYFSQASRYRLSSIWVVSLSDKAIELQPGRKMIEKNMSSRSNLPCLKNKLWGPCARLGAQELRQIWLNACLLVSYADNFCKQFGTKSDPTKCRAWSGPKLFDILMVFLKEFFQKVDFGEKKNHQTTKKFEKLPSRQS